jgi:hypothetical protein
MTDGSAPDDPFDDVEWPADEQRYRLQTPATDDEAPLDVLAAVLDASPRTPATATVQIGAGRRDDRDRVRSALSDLAAHPDVRVDDGETSGTVPVTDDTFAALADLSDDVRALVVRDDDEAPILERRGERFRFVLPDGRVEALRSTLPTATFDRLDPLER